MNIKPVYTNPLRDFTFEYMGSAEFSEDPYPVLKHYREEAPISWSTELNAWLFFAHEDVKFAFNNDNITNNRELCEGFNGYDLESYPHLHAAIQNSPFTKGASPVHYAYRKIAMKVFNSRSIARLRADIKDVTLKALSPLLDTGEPANFYDNAEVMSFEIMRKILGIPDCGERRDAFINNCRLVAESISPLLTPAQLKECDTATAELMAEIDRLITERKADPRDDVITDFISALDEFPIFDETHIAIILASLISSGTRGNLHGIMMTVKTLYDHPQQLEALQSDPTLIKNAITELARFNGSTRFLFRYLACDMVYKGYKMKKGQMIMVSAISANRDESVFDNADSLDIKRCPQSLKASMSFGHGHHFCLGHHMAMAQLEDVLTFFLEHILADRVLPEGVVYGDDFISRVILKMPIARE